MENHYIAEVQDSINDYTVVQSRYFDGTQHDAEQYFREVLSEYFNNPRYQIIMKANSVVLQWPEPCEPREYDPEGWTVKHT